MKGLISPTKVSGLRAQMSPWGFVCLFFFLNIYLFLDALGLRHCLWAFSSSGGWGLFSSCCVWASHC